MIRKEASGNEGQPGWGLSRDCIRDTLIAKRSGVFQQKNKLFSALCAANLRNLRETQLAPHVETKLIANRYKIRKAIRKPWYEKCECCQAVSDFSGYVKRADNRHIQTLSDNNMALCDDCLEMILREADASSDDSAVVYLDDETVQWVAVPEGPVASYGVADTYVFESGDEDECRCYFINFLIAHKPGMRMI